jgi:hypothetical protein
MEEKKIGLIVWGEEERVFQFLSSLSLLSFSSIWGKLSRSNGEIVIVLYFF